METFMETVRRGDVAAATLALESDSLVAQHVRDVEARIIAVGSAAFVPSTERFRLQQLFLEDPRAWFYCGAPGSSSVLFSVASPVGTDTIAWLYGAKSSKIPDMTHTLAFSFYGLLMQATQRNDIAVTELLLTSSTFVDVFADSEQQVFLEDAMARIGGRNAEAMVSLLVAHGAKISGSEDDSLPVYGSRTLASPKLLRHIAREGACFVGLQRVLHRMLADGESLRELLCLGIDLRDDAVVDLRGTANAGTLSQLDIISVILADGIVDVDAQDNQGRFVDSGTALIRAVRGLFGIRVDGIDETPAFVDLLLRFGADRSRQDRRGFSAVDYLMMCANDEHFKVLHDRLVVS